MTVVLLVAIGMTVFALLAWSSYTRAGGTHRGLANSMDITTTVSAAAVRRNALITRPTTRTTWKTPGHHVGIEIGHVRWMGVLRRTIYAGFRDIILLLAPPGTGKTGYLAGRVQDAIGAAIAASSRADLFWKSVDSRRRRPIYVFNPDDIGHTSKDPDAIPVAWDPTAGCRNPRHAWLVAGLHVGAGSNGGMKDSEFWETNAVRAFRCLLAAADLEPDLDMAAVYGWIGNLTDPRPVAILRKHKDEAPAGWASDLEKLQKLPDKTLGSISTTLINCVQYMADETLAAVATPAPEDHFDIHEFLRAGASFYLIGKHRDHDPVGPLFAALTGVMFETAVHLAEASKGHRLDPPLTAVLDEATNIFRGPLDMWTSYFGGSGIPMVIAAQSRHQLQEAYGDNGAHIIWDNATVTLAYGGNKDREHLKDLCELAGDRACEIGSTARRPVLTPRDILQLGNGQGARPREVLILRQGIPPIIARSRMAWERKHPPVAEPLVAPRAAKPDLRVIPGGLGPRKAA